MNKCAVDIIRKVLSNSNETIPKLKDFIINFNNKLRLYK